MVQFGQTLNDVVKRDWRCHAVSYMELKRALRTETTNNDDANSIHTESSYNISELQKETFATIYNDSVVRLVAFYQDKAAWARLQCAEMEGEAVHCLQGGGDEVDIQGLIGRLSDFSRDLGLMLEFLELNAMAFSKIMKKFDKRTGSHLREVKLQELKTNHSFLFNGGTLKQIKTTTDDWIKQLFVLQAKVRSKREKGALTGTTIEFNPQESTTDDKKSVTWDDKVCSRSIHETKESKFITACIDKVNEELAIQKCRSPFFDSIPTRNSPPFFESTEVKVDKVLGMGEYCRIHEVVQFEVPESCHICFLHRGFDDEQPATESSTLSSAALKKEESAAGVTETISSEAKNGSSFDCPTKSKKFTPLPSPRAVQFEIPKTLSTAEHNSNDQVPKKTQDRVISFFSFQHDDNISDYDDLEEDHEDEYDHETRGFMKDHCLRAGEARYAIKRIRHELQGEDIVDAAIDLAREAQFLAGLSHPSIIKIRGTCGVAGHPKFSIVLDRLYGTLESKMLIWKEEVKQKKGPLPLLGFKKDKKALNKNWVTRLICAYDIAHGMNYLHSNGILHRDLKPANIGFDIRGDVKIFDLGLAKELKPSQQVGSDQFHTSGIAGTRRYMAPEVAQVMPYGLSADVYSYGILVWEMMTLKPAYDNYTRSKHYKEVVVEGKRPKLPRSWPYVERNLLERCWNPKPSERPSFQAICQLIKFGLPDETFESTRSVDLALRSLRSTGRNMKSVNK